MTRPIILTLCLIATLVIGNGIIAGVVQCDAARACPYATEFGDVR